MTNYQITQVPIGRMIRALSLCSFIEDRVDKTDHSIQEFLDALASPASPKSVELISPVVEIMVDKLNIPEEEYYPSTETLELTLTVLKRFSVIDYYNRELRPTEDN